MDGHNGLTAFFKRDCIKGVYLFKDYCKYNNLKSNKQEGKKNLAVVPGKIINPPLPKVLHLKVRFSGIEKSVVPSQKN